MIKRYVCTGSCHGVATDEQWANGAKTCAAEDCEKHNDPLEERDYCPNCDKLFMPGEEHSCD